MNQQDSMHVPLRERKKQRVLQQIQEAAFELFQTIGYEHTTMDAIADKAETSRGTVFKYFPSKGSLWLPFLKQRYLEYVQPQVQEYLNTNPSTLQALRFLFTKIYEHLYQFPGVGHAFLALKQDVLLTHLPHGDSDRDADFIDMIRTILLVGQQRGDVCSTLPLEVLTHFVTIFYLSEVSELLERSASPEYLLVIENMLEFLRSGLG